MVRVENTNSNIDSRPGREAQLSEFVQFAKKVSTGLIKTTDVEIKQFVAKFSKAAGLLPDEIKWLEQTLANKLAGSRSKLDKDIDASVQKAYEGFLQVSKDEVTRIENRLVALEAKI